MSVLPLTSPTARDWLATLPPGALVILYKHSPICGTSALARQEVLLFAEQHPDLPVVEVDVIGQRPLARELAEVLGVPHASPQVIVLRDGVPVWTASHWAIRRDELERHLG